jgi:uncharacterized protein (TIGR02453 family)
MTLTGIPIAALDFYEDLEADNSKAWWTAHKSTYDEHVKAPLEALSAALAPEFGASKMFRPYRDVRFARDKTPYKTHQGVWFGETSNYLQISAAGLFVAAGYWETSSAQVERLRRAISDDVSGVALTRVLAAIAKANAALGGHQLTRVPNSYAKDHQRADLLRYKTLTVHRDLGCPAWLSSTRARTEIAKAFRSFTPLVSWLDTHVGRD